MVRRPPRRSRPFASFVTAGLSGGAGFAGSAGRIYGLALLLLVMLFFMVTFRGKVPRAIEKVFQEPVDEAVLEGKRKKLATLVGGAYLDPADGAGFAQTPGYRRLIQMLIDHVRPGDVVENPPLFNRELAMRAPDLQRGEVVKLRGLVAGYWAEKLDNPVFQVDAMWHTFLADYDGTDGVVVDVVDRPPALTIQRDTVEVVAHFYRLVSYKAQNGNVLKIPYLIARELRLAPEEPHSAFGSMDPASLILVLALSAMVAFGVIRVVSARARRPTVQWRAPHLHSHTSQPSSEGQH
ncbi:MAG TPA: hypothetical protein VFD82_06150 [Planctomycetota bacterium]|nr:hypothetical protein [Planctomycetota bacterium]